MNLIQGASPGDDEEQFDDPVPRKTAWLQSHPGGTIGRPNPDQLGMAAAVDGTVVATAYADLGVLMSNVAKAEADGRCPLHPKGPLS